MINRTQSAAQYKSRPVSHRVLIIDPKKTIFDNGNMDEQHWKEMTVAEKQEYLSKSQITTSPAAIGEGGSSTTRIPVNKIQGVESDSVGGFIDEVYDSVKVKPLAQKDEADVFGDPTSANKQWVLTALGFRPMSGTDWWSDDLQRFLCFDLNKDDLKTILPLLIKEAQNEVKQNLQDQFKALLGI